VEEHDGLTVPKSVFQFGKLATPFLGFGIHRQHGSGGREQVTGKRPSQLNILLDDVAAGCFDAFGKQPLGRSFPRPGFPDDPAAP
jgi:hypothetical protein